MAKRIPFKTGDEYEALGRSKRHHNWRERQRKQIKRKYNRRERRIVKHRLYKIWKQELELQLII